MTFDELSKNVAAGKYKAVYEKIPTKLPATHIEDENQTVVWNREFVKTHNAGLVKIVEKNRQAEMDAYTQFLNDMIAAIMDEYGLNEDQAKHITVTACDQSHDRYCIYEAKTFAKFYIETRQKETQK